MHGKTLVEHARNRTTRSPTSEEDDDREKHEARRRFWGREEGVGEADRD
jgi:hypothetical protein